jgi:hypothetical protein
MLAAMRGSPSAGDAIFSNPSIAAKRKKSVRRMNVASNKDVIRPFRSCRSAQAMRGFSVVRFRQ